MFCHLWKSSCRFLYRFTTDLCHFIFSMPGMDPLYPAVFPGKFLYDSDRIENPDISRFFQSMDSALSCKLSSWRYHELAPSLFWKIFPDHIFSFHPWHLWFFLLYHGLLFLKKLWKSQDHSFDVILTVNGKDFHLKAFLDSGNHLSDPLTGKPVHIISKDACQKISSQISPGRLRYIPYRTIQKTTSILPVFSVKKMRITGESEFLIHSPLIGISEQKNFGNGKYEMLLHPEDC